MVRIIVAYLLAVFVAYTLGSIASTQAVLNNLVELGVAVEWTIRLQTTAQDLAGMAGTYLLIVAFAFALALPWLCPWAPC